MSSAGQTEKTADPPWRALVIECVPTQLPGSFVAERARIEGAGALFEQTRDIVLTTLGLFLGTGRWAGDAVNIVANPVARPGTSEECRALWAIAGGARPATLPASEEVSFGRFALTGIVGYDYVPIQVGEATVPPQIRVRLAVALADQGKVRFCAPVAGQADYARVTLGYQERSSDEVAQTLTQRLAQGLKAAVSRLK